MYPSPFVISALGAFFLWPKHLVLSPPPPLNFSSPSFSQGRNIEIPLFVLLVSFFSYQSTDVSQQKKAYRILEQICGNDSDTGRKFVSSHLKELQEILLKTLASSSSASKTVSTDATPTKTPREKVQIHLFSWYSSIYSSFTCSGLFLRAKSLKGLIKNWRGIPSYFNFNSIYFICSHLFKWNIYNRKYTFLLYTWDVVISLCRFVENGEAQ